MTGPLARQFETLFPPARRQRGALLFEAGAVEIQGRDGDETHALVWPDDDEVKVHVMVTGKTLTTDCTCLGPPFCEHAFAVVLQLDRLARSQERQAAAAIASTPATPAPERPTPAPKPGNAADAHEWRQRWKQVESTTRPIARPASKLPGYVVDLTASRDRDRLVGHIVFPATENGDRRLTTARSLDIDGLPPTHRDLAHAILGSHGKHGHELASPFMFGATMTPVLVRLLAATDNVFVIDSVQKPTRPAEPLRFDLEQPFVGHVTVQRTANAVLVSGELRRGNERLAHPDVAAVIPGFALLADRIVPVRSEHGLPLLRTLLLEGPLHAPRADEHDLVGRVLEVVSGDPDIQCPVRFEPATAPVGAIEVRMAQAMPQHVPIELLFEYASRRCEAEGPTLLPPMTEDGAWQRRDLDAEQQLATRLVQIGGDDLDTTGMAGCYLVRRKQLDLTLTRLVDAGFLVVADGKPLLRSTKSHIAVRTGIDWFEVEGALEFDGGTRVPLAQAVAAIRQGARVVQLGDGRTGMLPTEWLASWATVLDLGEAKGDTVRLRRAQGALLDALLASRAPSAIATDQGYREFQERLAGFRGIGERKEPKGFQGTLRPYQRQGLGWLHFLREQRLGGCLADDMGLGKTVQVLALLQEVHRGGNAPPSLLVVPRSLLDNWRREAARFAPTLRVLDFTGSDRWPKRPAGRFDEIDIVVTTYGTLRQDAAKLAEAEIEFEYAILDEAQAIENEQSLTSKAVRVLRARHRLALTGTPVQNHLGELWALFEFLVPGLLGKSRAFKTLLAQSQNRGGDVDLQLLHKTLAPFLLRRTKEQVLPDLPEKQEQQLICDLDGDQRSTYDALKQHYQQRLLRGGQKLDNDERFAALEALLRLRQAACHPGLIDGALANQGSAKLDALLPMLSEIADSGHKALVFSQFTGFLAIVKQRLNAAKLRYEYLDGQTRNRQQCVDKFQNDPALPIFLISLKAGGTGLNLTAADYVFLLDPWWNPAAEAQAIDRAHRLGQTRKVVAYRLIARDTVEEKVLALQADKRQLVAAVLSADQSLLSKMTRDDLALLLG
ncbi:MAG: DEAD/DEAH box helicase [Planctomycetes bacterium]|nr:DEAD/DEAH box helicase [Planctomycetota bacterium]